MDKLYRQWLMMSLLPTAPRKIDSGSIEKLLREAGCKIGRRTIQRNLMELSQLKVFPIVYDDRSIPYGWSWMREGAVFNIPSMAPHTALTFLLVEKYLAGMLPSSTRDSLKAYIDNAGKVLKTQSGKSLRDWPQKIRVVPRNFQLSAPEIKPEILDTVFDAVLKERKLALSYRRRNETTMKEYEDLNPLGLVFVDNLIYLVCTLGKYENPLQFLLHRMDSATMLPNRATIPAEFSLEGYLEKEEFNYPTGEGTIHLKALFDRDVATYLFETRFPGELILEETEEETVLLEAEVEDSYNLRRWLLGFGDGVEILEPEILRDDFIETSKNLRRMYKRK